ncbi:MAG: Uncharacterised protein [SAR116 cluster bacterium]|nr:MAG: Uncharacterised protein [SAR116 cluster bacterium]
MDRFDVTNPALADHGMGLLDNRIEAPVVSDHHNHIRCLGVLYQRLAFSQIVRKRLFNQNRDTGINAQPALGCMKRSWCRQNDAIRLDSLDQFLERVEVGHLIGFCLILAFRAGIGNSA